MQSTDPQRRIRLTWAGRGRLNHILRNGHNKFRTRMKTQVLEQCIISILTWKTWGVRCFDDEWDT